MAQRRKEFHDHLHAVDRSQQRDAILRQQNRIRSKNQSGEGFDITTLRALKGDGAERSRKLAEHVSTCARNRPRSLCLRRTPRRGKDARNAHRISLTRIVRRTSTSLPGIRQSLSRGCRTECCRMPNTNHTFFDSFHLVFHTIPSSSHSSPSPTAT